MNNFKKLIKLFDFNAYKSLLKFSEGHKKHLLKITFLNIFLSLASVLLALITKGMIDYAISGNIDLTIKYAIYFALLLLIYMTIDSYRSLQFVKTLETLRNTLQLRIISQIYEKKPLHINNYKSGDLLTRIYDDINNIINALITCIPQIISMLFQVIIAFILLAYFDPLLAILTFIIAPITVVISMIIGSKLKKIQHNIQTAESKQRSMINESLHNISVLKAYDYIDTNIEHISSLQKDKFSLIKRKNYIKVKSNIILDLGYNIGFFSAFAFGAYRLYTGMITFGTLTAFVQLVNQIQGPFSQISISIPQLISSLSSVERINELQLLPNDKKESKTISDKLQLSCLQLKNVCFSYKKDEIILKSLDLTINKGDKIAITGPSGEGKTTLINILLAMLDLQNGSARLFFDNNCSYAISASTRKYFSYVSQKNHLFSGTIKENLFITNIISEKDIETALKASCAYEFISELENGIDTILHEEGGGLSQGQIQRICIARAFLHHTPILILDEATSALDIQTERQLIKNISITYPDKTVIAITHREHIFEICNKIYKLKDKKLIEYIN